MASPAETNVCEVKRPEHAASLNEMSHPTATPDSALTTAVTLSVPPRGADAIGLHVDLIRPPMVVPDSTLSTHGPTPPTGLAYIAAAIRDAGHDVHVVDAPGEDVLRYEIDHVPHGIVHRVGLSVPDIVNRIRPDVDVIGVNLMFFQEWPVVRELTTALKLRFPTVPIIAGGETATAFASWIFEQSDAIDVIVKGEGERTVVDLLQSIGSGETPNTQGAVMRGDNGEMIDGGLPVRIRDLAEVSRPAWDLFPLANYWEHPYFGIDRGRSMPVLATRGCPYQCTFCSAPQMWTTRYTVRDPKDLVDEIVDYIDRFAIQNVNFVDLTAITKRSWAISFCQELIDRSVKVGWQLPLGTRSEILDDEVLDHLARAGCTNVVYAPETGSRRMVKLMDKRVDLDKLLTSLTIAHRKGMTTHVSIIIGHPKEQLIDLAKSAIFLVKAALKGCDDAAAIMFCPYPGSADFRDLLDSGRFRIDESAYYVGLGRSSSAATSFNPRMSAKFLRLAQLSMMALFYGVALMSHPRRSFALAMQNRRGEETTYLQQMLRSRKAGKAARQRSRPANALGTDFE